MGARHYSGSIDGDIREYLRYMHENNLNPSFTGYEPYRQMLELGLIVPGLVHIRLFDRVDESYVVADENHLEGLIMDVHSGKKGLHNTKEILTNTEADFWEISGLDPKAYRLAD